MTKEIVKASSLIPFLNQKFKKDLKFNKDSVIERKETLLTKPESLDENNLTVRCIVTTETVDRMGDIVIAKGVDTSEFVKINNVYSNHDYSLLSIGKCLELIHKPKDIDGIVKFIKDDELSMKHFNQIKNGIVMGVSIGYEVEEAIFRGTKAFDDICKSLNLDVDSYNRARRIITKWKLYEFSLVSMPCNTDCKTKKDNSLDRPVEVIEAKPEDIEKPEVKEEAEEKPEDKPEEVKEVTEEHKEEVEEVKGVKEVNPNVAEEMKDHVKLTKYLKECGLNDEQVEGAFEKIVEGELDKDPDFYKQDKEEEEVKDIEPDKDDKEEEEKSDDVLVTHPLVDKDPISTPIEPKKIVIIPQVKRFIQVIKTPDDDKEFVTKCVEARIKGKTRVVIV